MSSVKRLTLTLFAALVLLAAPALDAQAKRKQKSRFAAEIACTVSHNPLGPATFTDNPEGASSGRVRARVHRYRKRKPKAKDVPSLPVVKGARVDLMALGADYRYSARAADLVDDSDSGVTGGDGFVNLEFRFNSFGTYPVTLTFTKRGFKKGVVKFKVSVQNLVNGPCLLVR